MQHLHAYGDGGDACTLDDYNEIVIQFCFVVLFGVAFPATGVCMCAYMHVYIGLLMECVLDVHAYTGT